MWTALNRLASSMKGRFSVSESNFQSAPNRLEISELCIFGFSWAIFLLWPLDQTMNAFIGLLTRSKSFLDIPWTPPPPIPEELWLCCPVLLLPPWFEDEELEQEWFPEIEKNTRKRWWVREWKLIEEEELNLGKKIIKEGNERDRTEREREKR